MKKNKSLIVMVCICFLLSNIMAFATNEKHENIYGLEIDPENLEVINFKQEDIALLPTPLQEYLSTDLEGPIVGSQAILYKVTSVEGSEESEDHTTLDEITTLDDSNIEVTPVKVFDFSKQEGILEYNDYIDEITNEEVTIQGRNSEKTHDRWIVVGVTVSYFNDSHYDYGFQIQGYWEWLMGSSSGYSPYGDTMGLVWNNDRYSNVHTSNTGWANCISSYDSININVKKVEQEEGVLFEQRDGRFSMGSVVSKIISDDNSPFNVQHTYTTTYEGTRSSEWFIDFANFRWELDLDYFPDERIFESGKVYIYPKHY